VEVYCAQHRWSKAIFCMYFKIVKVFRALITFVLFFPIIDHSGWHGHIFEAPRSLRNRRFKTQDIDFIITWIKERIHYKGNICHLYILYTRSENDSAKYYHKHISSLGNISPNLSVVDSCGYHARMIFHPIYFPVETIYHCHITRCVHIPRICGYNWMRRQPRYEKAKLNKNFYTRLNNLAAFAPQSILSLFILCSLYFRCDVCSRATSCFLRECAWTTCSTWSSREQDDYESVFF
jgi:hypothetical protein